MKYAVIIPDGAADDPLAELGGKTPFEAAHTPNMDWIAEHGQQGLVRTIPDGFESGSDVAIMSLLGYDPVRFHTGRAPLEAAARAIPLSATDWVFRCNLVTVVDDVMKDHSAGGISDAEARRLLADLGGRIARPDLELHMGVSYRNLMVYRGKDALSLTTKPPHEIPEQPIGLYLPRGAGSEMLLPIMAESRKLFADHEVNRARRASGQNRATQVWFWGQGRSANLPAFSSRFGVASGCMITGVDLLRGLAALLGWRVREVEGMTSFHDTNYAGQGAVTAAALDEFDIVVSHVEAPDEASHQADTKTKIASIEAIDRHVVGPVLEKLRSLAEWRILVLPDHPTNIATRKHGLGPTCMTMAGTKVSPGRPGGYCERNAAASGLSIDRGHELMEYFLYSGLR